MEEPVQNVSGIGAAGNISDELPSASHDCLATSAGNAADQEQPLEEFGNNTKQEEEDSTSARSPVGGIENDNGSATETQQQGTQQSNIIQQVTEEVESETQQPESQVELDERAKRRTRRMQRRTIPAPSINNTAATPPTRHSVGSTPTAQNLNANEPGGGLVLTPSSLATPTREAPEPAFKPARPAAPIQPPRVGAVHCTDRPEMQPGTPLMSTSNHSTGHTSNHGSVSNLSDANANANANGGGIQNRRVSFSSLPPPRASVKDVVSAEVVPETQLDLERTIRDSLFRSSSLRRDIIKDAPVAEIVPLGDSSRRLSLGEESAEADQKAQSTSRLFLMRGVFCLLVLILILIVAVVVLATQGHFSDDQDEELSTSPAADMGVSYEDDFVLASAPETIPYDRLPYMGYEGRLPQPMGSPVTNLVAQSRLWNVPEADLSILNAGEIRSEIEQGHFTYGNFTSAFMPFNNNLLIVTLNGKQIQSLLERVLQGIVSDLALGNPEDALHGAYPYAAGLRYNVNLSQAFPHRVSNLEINLQLSSSGDWTELNLTAPYRIVTTTYLQQGGDGYHELSTAEEALETGLEAQDAFVEYCLHHKVLVNPPNSTYSTQSFHFVPGMYDNWNA